MVDNPIVEADRDICIGSGQCEMLLPNVFTVGDEGTVDIDVAAAHEADTTLLQRAVQNCPTAALRLGPTGNS
ncbi:ferredoxin [Nocardia sp. AB354]|uniref:ferredoxin n=1 Tax=Nocardia sp. AB354 TaxID=3413283 RepID=UPI003C133FDC